MPQCGPDITREQVLTHRKIYMSTNVTPTPPRNSYGANINTRALDRSKFDSLRSTFKIDGDDEALTQGRAYFPGGQRDPSNICTFSYEEDGVQDVLTLYLSPNNVTWDYKLKTNVIDTYGGQVVQVLGVSIENLTIQGFFGSEGMWGFNFDEFEADNPGKYQSRFSQGDRRNWEEKYGKMGNGLVQFSEWFKTYFYKTTQAGKFSRQNMVFRYPHMNWVWKIRPLNFPRVRFANDELLPQWSIECDFIEDIQSSFISEVTNSAKTALSRKLCKIVLRRPAMLQKPFQTSLEKIILKRR